MIVAVIFVVVRCVLPVVKRIAHVVRSAITILLLDVVYAPVTTVQLAAATTVKSVPIVADITILFVRRVCFVPVVASAVALFAPIVIIT